MSSKVVKQCASFHSMLTGVNSFYMWQPFFFPHTFLPRYGLEEVFCRAVENIEAVFTVATLAQAAQVFPLARVYSLWVPGVMRIAKEHMEALKDGSTQFSLPKRILRNQDQRHGTDMKHTKAQQALPKPLRTRLAGKTSRDFNACIGPID